MKCTLSVDITNILNMWLKELYKRWNHKCHQHSDCTIQNYCPYFLNTTKIYVKRGFNLETVGVFIILPISEMQKLFTNVIGKPFRSWVECYPSRCWFVAFALASRQVLVTGQSVPHLKTTSAPLGGTGDRARPLLQEPRTGS